MANDKFTMSLGLAHELEMACERNGLTAKDIKCLVSGNTLKAVALMTRGMARPVIRAATRLVATVTTPSVKRFDANVMFGQDNPDGIRFSYVGAFPMKIFSRVETNIPATDLFIRRVDMDDLDDGRIDLDVCLHTEVEIVALASIYILVKAQPHGEDGPLMTRGMNVFNVQAIDRGWLMIGLKWDHLHETWDFWEMPDGRPANYFFHGFQVVSRRRE